tara:strand:- start:370 stop:756 length:387 start_codon:yes stop_codon:yes gene_type:complete
MFQPKFPLKLSDTYGPYDSIVELKESVKQNVMTILMVSPGEWPNDPRLGVGVRRFLFENSSSDELSRLESVIKNQFSRYLPFLEVDSQIITVDANGNHLQDSNMVKLVVRYNIEPLNVQDFLEISSPQ